MKFFEKNVPSNSFFISNELSICGTLEGNLSGRIEGVIRGDVKINGKVIIGETGVIEGNIKCYELVVNGVIHGDAIAHASIVVSHTGIIHGNVSSNSIVVDPKSKVRGSIKKTMDHDISREIKMIEVQETKFVEDKVKEDLGDLLVDGKSASLKNKNGFW
jgi:cytoskeletal protein CcmA (bactofilin family)